MPSLIEKGVAAQKYGLDVLVQDEAWQVRKEVAKQGYGLKVLIRDENLNVRNTALKSMRERGEFYELSTKEILSLEKSSLNHYFGAMLNSDYLNSEENRKEFIEVVTELIKKYGNEVNFVKQIERICKRFNIKIVI